MEYLLIALICYVIGMINPTLLIGFFKRVNVRKTGSRNPGTSNAAMTFGLRYGIFVGIIDILKGAMPVVVLRVMYPDQDLMHVLGGFFAIPCCNEVQRWERYRAIWWILISGNATIRSDYDCSILLGT